MSPDVSIVMPVYRPLLRHAEPAIESILRQTYSDLELVIVEDPSQTSVAGIVERLADPRIVYVRNGERTSLVRQHNRALELARGRYLGRMDADDMAHEQRVERSVEFLDSHRDVSLVGSWIRFIDDEGNARGVRKYPAAHEEIVRAMARMNPLANSSVLFRREVFETIGGWSEGSNGTARDYEWFSRGVSRGFVVANLQEVLLDYRLHEQSVKTTRLKETLATTLEVKREYWAGAMTFRDRLTFLAEKALLHMPDRVVLSLFLHTRARGRA